jgi:hypothetical protein
MVMRPSGCPRTRAGTDRNRLERGELLRELVVEALLLPAGIEVARRVTPEGDDGRVHDQQRAQDDQASSKTRPHVNPGRYSSMPLRSPRR